MKNSLLHRRLVIFILMSAFMYMSCNNGKNDPVAAKADDKQALSEMAHTDTSKAVKNWNLIEAHYKKVIEELSAQGFRRKDSNKQVSHYNAAQPIDTAFGNAYMEAYRKEISDSRIQNSVYSIILTEQSLAFYLKYLLDHPEDGDSIVAAFGKYDSDYLYASRRIQDPVLEDNKPNYKNQHTLIVGLRNPKSGDIGTHKTYCRPFEVPGYQAFYDDWHNGWPPPKPSTP